MRDERTRSPWSRQNSHMLIKFTGLLGHNLWHPKTVIVITSKITDHRSP